MLMRQHKPHADESAFFFPFCVMAHREQLISLGGVCRCVREADPQGPEATLLRGPHHPDCLRSLAWPLPRLRTVLCQLRLCNRGFQGGLQIRAGLCTQTEQIS